MTSRAARYDGLVPASAKASRAAQGSSKKKNTRCEVVLRAAVEQLGLKPEDGDNALPGRPDLMFREGRILIFCDGDFWHGRHLNERLAKLAKGHNAPYWVAKIRGNVARDVRSNAALEADGWLVLRYWEKDIHADPERIATEIARYVRERRELRG